MQLFEKSEKDENDNIYIESFLEVLIEGIDELNKKIEKSKEMIENYEDKKQEALVLLDKAEKTEVLNSYGIIHDSSVHLQVFKGNNLNSNFPLNAYVLVKLQDNEFNTDSAEGKNPIWNSEVFSL